MDYLYENLGDERFQEFCSCLIAKEFPNSQSYPVGQPDGGRDSLTYFMDSSKKDFIVIQVKFVRNPNLVADVHKWFVKIIEDEAPKVKKLIPKGAKSFYLLTNVKGTAHLDAGSIDKVNLILETHIPIPSICWWRDDITSKFEKDPLFMWSFPEILNGQDILNSILFNNINENRERRENVLKAYLADQYDIDNEVKFRQIDLHNKLFDLFTDVPLRIKKFNSKNKMLKKTLEHFEHLNHLNHRIINPDLEYLDGEEYSIGAASFLLHPKIQNEIERILLEGGPGQGKSTISQFICQVHRARLLNKLCDLSLLPDYLMKSPIRIPFKIDLRHIASWVEKVNPYKGRLNDEYFNSIWKNSLESFLVGHIIYHSQIDDFSSTDLIAIIKQSSILFVFDGFDEIANIEVREEVIDFINKGVNRISENSKSIQIVITSRPAAFSDSIGFSVEEYPHFELTDITPLTIRNYVEKWIKASRLNSREASELKRLVNEKLELPHLRDLAKSPMQLAIFISLLRTRGESLPNKRTALYDSYIELFFNRESEKSTIIRENRDLIIDIHQYLAWILHSEAELYKNSGSIQIDELKSKLNEYLNKEGHKTDIADKLFHVMEERVCALVSRVQGTYEFEVQPLREYFCAKYLYNTSPYSPAGLEKSGTKADRFDAIARNFYWHNVVRFFAGCFDKGELPLLIQKLRELQEDKLLKYTNYPRLITSQILSDWVFTQYPLLLKDVVKIIVNGINIGSIINQEGRFGSNDPILLPNECGRAEVVNECFEQLKGFPHNDYSYELISLIKNNPHRTMELWLEYLPSLKGERLTKWFEYAYRLELIYKLNDHKLIEIIQSDDIIERNKRLQLLINGNKLLIVDKNIELKSIVFEGILDYTINAHSRDLHKHSLQFLTLILHPYLLSSIFEYDSLNVSLISYLNRRGGSLRDNGTESLFGFNIEDNIDGLVSDFSKEIESVLLKNISEWRSSIQPWDILVESIRKIVGDKWRIYIISVIAAGIKSKNELNDDFSDLNDSSKSLCKRVRNARLKSGNINFWVNELDNSTNILFSLLVLLTWATPKALNSMFEKLSDIVENLPNCDYVMLSNGLKRTAAQSRLTSSQVKEIKSYIENGNISDKLKYLIFQRFDENIKHQLIYSNIKSHKAFSDDIIELRLNYLVEKYLENSTDTSLLKEIKDTYSTFMQFDERYMYYHRYYRNEEFHMPIDTAQEIMIESKRYPRIIASIAERSCRLHANKHLVAVGQVAKDEKWFD
jgi:hypothetical protein